MKIKAGDVYKPAELSEVLYVPSLNKNLFSVSAVTKRGQIMKFDAAQCVILGNNGNVTGSGSSNGRLYTLDASHLKNAMHEAHSAVEQKSLKLWHERFGHLNFSNLKLLDQQDLVDGLKFDTNEEVKFCEGCTMGKQTRNSFLKNEATRATKLLQIVHSDVCGPMKTQSIGGSRYFVTFIDDMSRYAAIYFIRSKDEVLSKFKVYADMATNTTGSNIRVLRTDNGGEYTSKVFDDFLRSKGIKRQLTTPRTPQQNGVAERMNRTIQESARSMLQTAALPDSFWAEAVLTAVILKNRSPTVTVKKMTPHEGFTGTKPDVSTLRVFGCDTYMHVDKELRTKWDAKSSKCIFIGYSPQRKAYRLWNPTKKKVHESGSVVFVENEFGNRIQRSSSVKKVDVATSTVESQVISIMNESESDEDHKHEDQDEENIADDPTSADEEDVQEQPRRSTRPRKAPDRGAVITGKWWDALSVELDEVSTQPKCIKEALSSPAAHQWKGALNDEYKSLIENEAWDLVELLKDRSPVGCR